MTGKERIKAVLEHRNADKIALDFSSTVVTGMHCRIIEALRKYYGLDEHPVYVYEPQQMLGLMEEDLAQAIGVDTVGCVALEDAFGIPNEDWKEYRMPWGQTVMFPAKLADSITVKDNNLYAYPEGDNSLPPSGVMTDRSFFFSALDRQKGEIDDDNLNVEDNLEEFGLLSDKDIEYWKTNIEKAYATDRAVVASLPGMALGDVAKVTSMALREPRGIRSVAEWYMSTIIRPDYIKEIFARQTDMAVENLKKIHAAVGDKIDVAYLCGTDFGTQNSQFCSVETFRDLYLPYYRRMNDWIHENTSWKVLKHCCGSITPLMDSFIDAGFDILTPVQIAAADMDPKMLKSRFGDRVSFWGGGINTQQTLPFGTPEDVRREVLELCDIFGQNGGFVFNSVHNIQANVPIENVIAMFETIKDIRA